MTGDWLDLPVRILILRNVNTCFVPWPIRWFEYQGKDDDDDDDVSIPRAVLIFAQCSLDSKFTSAAH